MLIIGCDFHTRYPQIALMEDVICPETLRMGSYDV